MKKYLFSLVTVAAFFSNLHAQCVQSCSVYGLSSITYTQFPTGGTDCVPLFSPNADDGYTAPIPIGFNFNFYCTNTNSVIISSNGFLTFDITQALNPSTSQTSQFLPNSGTPNAIACFDFNDLDASISGGGTITYTTIGVTPNQMFILTYSNVPIWANLSVLNSGQIVLYETSNIIEVHTATVMSGSPYTGTQGIENASGTSGVAVPGRNSSNWSASNSAYRWSQAFVPTPPTAVTGTQSSCEGITNSYTVSLMPGATSYSWSLPAFWSGTSTISAITATAGTSGQLSVAATYSCGTSAPITISVNVISSPFVSISSVTPVIFCSGPTVTITTSGAATYTLMPGNLVGTPPFTTTPLTSTTYTVMGTNAQGCDSKNLATYQITVKETPTVSVNSGSVCLGESFTLSPTGANTYVYSSIFSVVTPNTAGTYTYGVTGTATNGCVGQPATSTLTVFSLPVVTATASRASICAKESSTLTASGAINYSWTAGSTGSTTVVKPVITTAYTVIGVDVHGCSKTSTITITVNACTGLDDVSGHDLSLIAFPNPSQGIYTLSSEIPLEIKIYDISGRLVFSTSLERGDHQIDLTLLASGKYFLVAGSGELKKHIVLLKE